MQVKKQQLELNTEQQTGSKQGKEYIKAVYYHPAYLTYMQRTSWETLDWKETKAGIKIAGRNINNLRYADDTTLMAESEEELKILLIKVNEESEKVGLKLNIQKTKITAPSPINFLANRWGNSGNSDRLNLGGLQNHCRWGCHEIKRCLLLGRKAMTNPNSILKSRDITLPTKVHLVKTI